MGGTWKRKKKRRKWETCKAGSSYSFIRTISLLELTFSSITGRAARLLLQSEQVEPRSIPPMSLHMALAHPERINIQ